MTEAAIESVRPSSQSFKVDRLRTDQSVAPLIHPNDTFTVDNPPDCGDHRAVPRGCWVDAIERRERHATHLATRDPRAPVAADVAEAVRSTAAAKGQVLLGVQQPCVLLVRQSVTAVQDAAVPHPVVRLEPLRRVWKVLVPTHQDSHQLQLSSNKIKRNICRSTYMLGNIR